MKLSAEYSPLIDNDTDQSIVIPIKALKKKRDDLQCWRTVAIVGVVVFHVWPTWFPNGFVGVDIFFVLSGFLMATIIHRHDTKINLNITKDFYFRRVKRIVPVYLFVFLVVIFLLFLSLWEDEFEKVRKDAYWALGFVSNEQDLFEHRDYFDTQNNFKYFKHCWSLAVEMQFYLIVPVTFMLWLNFWTSGKFFILVLIFATSITLQIMSTSETTRYESMFSRIWQFTVGIAAQSYKLHFVDFSSIFHNIWIQTVFFFCLIFEFFPVAVDRETVSILCVISSGFLIAVSSSGENSPFNIYLTNNLVKKGLVYCGDFSYILYLVHWPLITYCRFVKSNSEFSVFEGSVIILACFMLAIIAHHVIENPLINYCDSFRRLLLLTGLLYLLISFPLIIKISETDEEQEVKTKNPIKATSSLMKFSTPFIVRKGANPMPFATGYKVSPLTYEMYRRILKVDELAIIPDDWSIKNDIEFCRKALNDRCRTWSYNCKDTYHKWTKIHRDHRLSFCESTLFPNGTYTAVVYGNSHAECASGAVYLNPLFKRVITMSAHACRVPAQSDSDKGMVNTNRAMMEVVEKFKPDVIFFISSYNGHEYFESLKYPLSEDRGYVIMDEMLKHFSKHSKAIILNLPNFRYPTEICPEFIRMKKQKKSFDFRIKRKSIREKDPKLNKAHARVAALDCPKCYWWDYQEALCGDNYCNPIDFDTGLPLMRDFGHINVLGMRKFIPILDTLTRKALNLTLWD